MTPSRCIYFGTIALHTTLVAIAVAKLVLQENVRSHLLEKHDGMLVAGALNSSQGLWTIALRLFQLIGVQALVMHVLAIALSSSLLNDPYSRHLNAMSHLWSVLTICCLLTSVLAMVLFQRFVDTMYTSMLESLFATLEMVQFEVTVSDFWNDLQAHNRCCGVLTYTDWQGMIWESAEQEAQFRRLVSGDDVVLVPFSCCQKSIHQRHHCIGERINLSSTELLRYVGLNTSDVIHHGGCYDAVRSDLAATIHAIGTLDAILCTLQFITLFCMRVLFMANRNSLSAMENI
ncbi:tetraspanin-9-like [Anopheles nili]|uniref:tetraspanin-9-like n=1 Tax=Anopheles nili TaxID=185578 RepID=UPI00237BE2AE|nr:tetraspanin-9-like [Anopheles nili]